MYQCLRTESEAQIGRFLLPDIRGLQEHLKPNNTEKGDRTSSPAGLNAADQKLVFSAISIAVQMITKETSGKSGLLKFDRKIVIVTDGQGYMDTEDLDQIAEKLKEDKYELTLL